MKRYIEQLVEEIQDLIKTDPPYKQSVAPSNFEEEMEIAEKVAMGEAAIPVTNFSKIRKEHLPPPDNLKDNEIEIMNTNLNRLLNHCQFWINFPDENMPERIKYELLRDNWEDFEIPVYDVSCHWDFCDGSCEICRVAEYCPDAFANPELKNIDRNLMQEFFEEEEECTNENEEIYLENRKEKIKSFIKTIPDKRYISGIYNYCDNWCDRCDLRNKCSSYDMEREVFKDRNYDINDPQLGIDTKAISQATSELLEEYATNLPSNHDNEDISREILASVMTLNGKKILLMAENYARSTGFWFHENQKSSCMRTEKNAEYFKVILWYHIFIPAKLRRALMNQYPDEDPQQNDINGSAKIALIAIERSMLAWSELMNQNPDIEDFAVQICIHLKKMKNEVENSFPEAWKFVRPGFDE